MATKKYINFLEFQDTSLDAGEYTIKLDQSLSIGNSERLRKTIYQQLYVIGDRFTLAPSQIHQVYPPSGSEADYQAVLPHLIMNRSQFPWERSMDGILRNSAPNYPWLALLVFHDDPATGEEPPKVQTINLEEYFQSAQAGEVFVPGVITDQSLREFLEYGEKKGDPVNIIDVPEGLLQSIMPKRSDLRLSAHVRRDMTFTGEEDAIEGVVDEINIRVDELIANEDEVHIEQVVQEINEDIAVERGQEYGVIVANRLPKAGCRNVVHLVSLRNAYLPPEGEFDFPGDGRAIRLVSLKSWSFFCSDQQLVFADILGDLSCMPFRLDTNTGKWVDQYIKDGFTLLPHLLRTGNRTVSFYRGPFSPGRPHTPHHQFALPVPSADHLLLYDEKSGVMDSSYAAAWTLGRQLALADQAFALELYQYKKRAAILLAKEKHDEEVGNLPLSITEDEAVAADEVDNPVSAEEKILDWLSTDTLLSKIPFPYLVPTTPQQGNDPEGKSNFLPEESIRFFQLDGFWLQCVRYGALSLGDIPDVEMSDDAIAILAAVTPPQEGMISGFLLRSKAVQFFPDLMVEGFSDDLADPTDSDPEVITGTAYFESGIVPTIRRSLSDEVLLCTFDGVEIQTVDIFLAPRSLHFGFVRDDFEAEGEEKLYKLLKHLDGSQLTEPAPDDPNDPDDDNDLPLPIFVDAEQWRDGLADRRILDLEALAQTIKTGYAEANDKGLLSPEEVAEFLKDGPTEETKDSFTSADYAMVMLNGAPRVRFSVDPSI